MSKVKRLSLASILLAGALMCLYLASLFPVMSMTLIAIASIITYVAIIECKSLYALLLYVATGVLGLLIVPDKSCVILYSLLFGAYPFIKHFSEKVPFKILSWIVKLLCINALIFILYVAFRELLLSFVPEGWFVAFAYLAFNVLFIVFDICITRLKLFYMWRIHRRII